MQSVEIIHNFFFLFSEHAVELGNPVPSKPVVFFKPPSSIITEGHSIKIPEGCQKLHHEVELAVVIGTKGSRIPEESSMDHVDGYMLALDMTARDFQDEAKSKGQPWSLAKGFDTSCPVSRFLNKDEIKNPNSVGLWLKVNDQLRQEGNTSDMIFSIPYLISYLSKFFTLEPGDLILTGTPSGVGPVAKGDTIQAGLTDIVTMTFKVEETN